MPEVKANVSDNKKLTQAKAEYKELLRLKMLLQRHNYIANAPLPDNIVRTYAPVIMNGRIVGSRMKKSWRTGGKKFTTQQQIIGSLLVRQRATETKLSNTSEKLKPKEIRELHRYGRALQGYAH